MKSEVKIATPEKTELKFPLLARSKFHERTVLFTDETAGVVVSAPSEIIIEQLGYWSNRWIDLADSSRWEILPVGSTVTLTQE